MNATEPGSGLDRWPEVVLVAVLTGVACLPYTGFFAGGWFLLPIIGAGVVGSAAAVLGTARRWTLGRLAAAALGALTVYLLMAAIASAMAAGSFGADAIVSLLRGVRDGWARMLTIGLPADATWDLLVVPAVVAWAAGLAGASLALRSRVVLAPLVPPLVAFGASLAFTAAQPENHTVVAGAFVLTALALVLVRANRLAATGGARIAAADSNGSDVAEVPAWRPAARRAVTPLALLAVGLPGVVVAAVAATAAANVVPLAQGDRLDPRDLRRDQLHISDTLSPLVRVKPQLAETDPQELFTVELEPTDASIDRIRVAVLPEYDGALWSSQGEYYVAGRELAPDPLIGASEAAEVIRQRIVLSGLEGPFLPTVGRPVRLDAQSAGFDPDSGTLVSMEPLPGYRYEVEGLVPVRGDQLTASSLPDGSPSLEGLRREPPELPPWLRELARTWTAAASSRMEQLHAIEAQLRAVPYDASSSSPPGHSYAALDRILQGEAADRRAYSEQLATAFVVLARSLGFASRLSVGYLLPEPDAEGRYVITEAQAHAWPEVAFEDHGWVVFEPTDVSKIGTVAESVPEEEEPEPEGNDPGDEGDDRRDIPPVVVDEALSEVGGFGQRVRSALIPLAVVLAVFTLALAAILATKAHRRRRRRTAKGPAQRVIGAWRETTERLGECGVRLPASLTPLEVADRVGDRFENGAAAGVLDMAALVSFAVYAPAEPADEDADEAWELEETVRGALVRQCPLVVRVRGRLDPRPLLPERLRSLGRSRRATAEARKETPR